MNYFVKDMTNFYKGSIPTPDSRPRNPPPEFRGRESGAGIDLGESQLPIPAPGIPGAEFRGRENAGDGVPPECRGRDFCFRPRSGAGAGIPGAGPSPEFRGWACPRNSGGGFRGRESGAGIGIPGMDFVFSNE